MSKPRVLNRRNGPDPPGSVYVGRPSVWGNPYRVGRDGTRTQVIQKYRLWLHDHPGLLAAVQAELRGKDLVCWCAPLPCHADVLLSLAAGRDADG